MSTILIRFGLYTILALLAVYVLREPLNLPAELLTPQLLTQVAIAGVGLLVLGFVSTLFDKATAGKKKTKCIVCRRPVLVGEMYCREHLREVIAEEQARHHAPPVTRR